MVYLHQECVHVNHTLTLYEGFIMADAKSTGSYFIGPSSTGYRM